MSRRRGTCHDVGVFESPTHFLLHHYGRPGDFELISSAAHRTEDALRALEAGDHEKAHALWDAVDGDALLEAWNSSNTRIRELGPKWSLDRPDPIGPPGRFVNATLARTVYERDSYRCRYCNLPVFTRAHGSRIRALIKAVPGLTPGMRVEGNALVGTGKNGGIRNIDYAKLLWSMAAPDHVFPRSLGGDATFDNLVTACSGCNYGKGELTLGQMNVRHPKGRTSRSLRTN